MDYTNEYVLDLISQVEKAFLEDFQKAEAVTSTKLVKSEEPKESKEEKPKEEHEEKPEHKESKEEPKSEEAPEKEAKPEHEAHQEPEHDEDAHDYDEEDLEHMHKMYGSMKKGELKAHHDSIRKCMDQHMAPKEGQAMEKSEKVTVVIPEVSAETTLLKSELEAEKAKNEELKKNLDVVTEFITKLNKKIVPQGKAITNLDVIQKSESFSQETKTLTKAEITKVLTEKSMDPSLKKSDREAINEYYGSGQLNIKGISHLLK